MATKFKRGQVVLRPDSWAPRAPHTKSRKGRAIVLEATAKRVVLCTFQPGHKIDSSNPHVGNYAPNGLQVVGKVQKIPAACTSTLKWKKEFWKQHPSVATPYVLKGAKRRRRR